MTLKVELGFTDAGVNPPFFTLDDSTRGVLDNTTYVLGGGEALVDVSSYLRTVSIQRGKSRELDRYDAGQASVTFNNLSRAFDPTFTPSPLYGQIVPRRRIRITADGIPQFDGVVDDWNIEIEPSGYSIATCQAFGPFARLAGLELNSFSPPQQLTGARVGTALNNVSWPSADRSIDTGGATLASQVVADGTPILDYLQLIAESEPGDIFGDKSGRIVFVDRNQITNGNTLTFSDSGVGIPYQTIRVVYGSELLYNRVTVLNEANGFTATDDYSIALYGERDIEINTLLANDTDLETLAEFLVSKYKEPEFRFEGLSVNLSEVTPAERSDLLTLELGDVISIELTPGKIPPAIQQYGKIISLNYSFEPGAENLEIGVSTTFGSLFILDDTQFGILDVGSLGW